MDETTGYMMFKGLQRPMELFGIKGRFIILFAASFGVSFVVLMLFSVLFSKLVGVIAMLACAGASIATILVKQKKGLHSKKRYKGIIICKNVIST